MSDQPEAPYDALGGEPVLRVVANAFYDYMEQHEPELTALHDTDEHGRITAQLRHDFWRFLVFWTGGPNDYLATRGHPRLGMRHASFRVDAAMRDAWLRSMKHGLDTAGVAGPAREMLDARFSHVSRFLQNDGGQE